MSKVLISPGVLARENDQTQITSQPVQAGAAIVGPTYKGKTNVPKLVTSYSEFLTHFGGSFTHGQDNYSFLTSISAYNYFQNGGTSLLVTKVGSGSFSPAVSTWVTSSDTGSSAFVLETISEGEIMNSESPENVKGALELGTRDNLRWEIVNPNIANGTFSVIIRRGDDNTKSKIILETFANVSLDPKASNYISRIIGDQTINVIGAGGADPYLQTSGSFPNASNYVRVKQVNLKTPDYFDNSGVAKTQYTASIPLAQSGTFDEATGQIAANATFYENISNTNSQGLVGTEYETAFTLLANKDEFKFNVITAPGLIYANANHSTPLNTLISEVEGRGDAIVVLDLENYNSTITAAVGAAAGIDSSYAAAYWPWVQITDPDTSQLVWIPGSTLIPGVFAYNDKTTAAWFAPAGLNRGGLNMVRQAERKLTTSNRDALYSGKVNPLATFPGRGVVAFGQKTLQSKPTALDRINVRRLLIELKSHITQVGDNLVFDQNTIATRNSFLSQVNPYLENVQQRQGLYAFKVVMDDSNNGPDVIDRNQLVGGIYIQPTRTAEFIYLDFNITPTGTDFGQ